MNATTTQTSSSNRRSPRQNGWRSIDDGNGYRGAVRWSAGEPVQVSDGGCGPQCVHDGVIDYHDGHASEDDLVAYLEELGWDVRLGAWSGGEGDGEGVAAVFVNR